MTPYTFAIAGCGKLAQVIVDALLKGLLPNYKLVGSYSRTFEKAQNIADKIATSNAGYNCKPCETFEELLQLKPDYIVEAASPAALRSFALPALKNGSSIVASSIGALADADFYKMVQKTALEYNTRVHLASGAIGGFDVMQTVALMGNSQVTFRAEKSPNFLKKSKVFAGDLPTKNCEVFKGDAKEAISLFPTQVNVAVATGLATVGPENLNVSINSIPDYEGDDHRIEIKSEQIHAIIDIYSTTPQVAGWSVVNTLRNIVSPIVF